MHQLSQQDEQFVQDFERKAQLIKDRVSSVIHGYHVGCYLVGRPGTSKSWTVRTELEKYEEPWAFQNARMTPMGLFDFLANHPEHTIVLDDIGTLFKSDQAMQILMAALDGNPSKPRTVTYKSKDKDLHFQFSGTIIAISNVPLRHDPLAQALGSRIVVLEHEPTDDELAAYARSLALRGFEDLDADECLQVVEFVLEETREYDLRLDLRHVTKAWQDFRQEKHGKAKTCWQDLVRTSLQKLVANPMAQSKKDEIEQEVQTVLEMKRRFPDDTQRQMAASGLKKSTFYKRLAEAKRRSA